MAEQGIFSHWPYSFAAKRPLKYLGCDGQGDQVRDAFHPDDLADFICYQLTRQQRPSTSVEEHPTPCHCVNFRHSAPSVFCPQRDQRSHPRPCDIPWLVMHRTASRWKTRSTLLSILEEIGEHAGKRPHPLEMSIP